MKKYILIALLMSVTLTAGARYFDGTEVIYIQQHPTFWSWYGNDPAAGKFAYFKKTTAPTKEQWSTEAVGVDYCNDELLQILVPEGEWDVIILTRNSVHSDPTWDNVFDHGTSESNQSIDITIHATQNYLQNFRQLKDQTTDNWLWSDYFTKPSGNPTTASSINGVPKELISVCDSAVGDPFSLQPTATAAGYEYDQQHTWFKWTGTNWKELRYGTNWGYTNANGLSETIGSENSHTYYFLSSNSAGKSRFMEVAVTEHCAPTSEITDFGVVTSSVNANDSTYTLDGIVAFKSANGNTLRISVTDSKGTHYIDSVNPSTPCVFSLSGLSADGATGVTATAEFLGTDYSRTSNAYDAPTADTGIKNRKINITQGVDTALVPSSDGGDGFKWSDGNTTNLRRPIPAYDFDTTFTYIYYEFENPPTVGGNLIRNYDFSQAGFDYGTPAYTTSVTGSKISDYNFWGTDIATTGNFYNDFKDGDQFLSGGMSIVQNANAFWRRYTKQISPKQGDHFALFDADNSGEKAAWKIETNATTQPDLKLAKGTNYMFSFWVANINNYGEMNNAAKLQFEISYRTASSGWSTPEKLGNPIDLNDCPDNLWHQNSFVYAAVEDADSVRISVKDLNTNANPGGNDFALDDIRFQPISVVSQAIKNCERFVVTVYEAPCVFSGIQIDTIRPKCSDADNTKYSLRITLDYDKQQGALTLTDNVYGPLTPASMTVGATQAVITIDDLAADGAAHTLTAKFTKLDGHGVDKGCETSGTYTAPGIPSLSLATPTVPAVGCDVTTFALTVNVTYAYQNGNQMLFYWDNVLHSEATQNITYGAGTSLNATLTGLASDGMNHTLTVKTSNTTYDCADSLTVAAPVVPTIDTAMIAFSTPGCTDLTTTLTFYINYTYQQGTLTYWVDAMPAQTATYSVADPTAQTLTGLTFAGIPADGKSNHVLHVSFDGSNSCVKSYTLPAVPFSPVISDVTVSGVPASVLCLAKDYPATVTVTTPYDATGRNIVVSYNDNGAKDTTVTATGTSTVINLTLHSINGPSQTISAAYAGSTCTPADDSFLPPTRVSCDKYIDTICYGDSYDKNGFSIALPAVGTDTFTIGYDSLILTVQAIPEISIAKMAMTCDDQTAILMPFTVTNGTPNQFDIAIGSNHYTGSVVGTDISFARAAELVAGDYSAVVTVGTNGSKCTSQVSVNFTIALGGTMLSKWTDVLFINNAAGQYVAYQWFKNGTELIGETLQRLYDPNGLSGTTDEYMCRLTTTDGRTLYTCPELFDNVTPSRTQETSGSSQVIGIYDTMGRLVQGTPAGGIYIVLEEIDGELRARKIMIHE